MKHLAIGALAGVVVLIGVAPPAHAQQGGILDTTSPPGIQLGPVGLSPVVRLTTFGYDSNIYNLNNDSNPVGDFNITVSPSIVGLLRSPHLRASGRSLFDFYYFQTLKDLRSVDRDSAGQVDFLINRVTLSLMGERANTRHRQNLEIDAIAQRKTDLVAVRAAVRVGGKTSLEGSILRAHLDYEPNSFYLNTDLAKVLNHTSTGATIGVRYALTHLTTVAVQAVQERARFDTAFERNSEEFRITPAFEFNPFALVTGRAAIGYYRRTFDLTGAHSSGTSVLVDLTYTLLGRTRITVGANRRPEYSYIVSLNDYVESGVSGSVTQRIGDSWDVIGRLGGARISYRQAAPTDVADQFPNQYPSDETLINFGADVGYNIGRSRIGLYVERNQRNTDESEQYRGYQRFRIGCSATYVF